jgi:hypothetical protein
MVWLITLMLSGLPHAAAAPRPDVPRGVVARPAAAAPADLLASQARRIRSGSKRLTGLIAEGVRRSRTFADLVTRLHQTDVIVYVEPAHGLPADMAGRIALQTVAGGQRYLRMQVRPELHGDEIIAVMGHELQHALEVAADPAVLSEAGVAALYRRIGHQSHGSHGYDTEAARTAGRLVRDELIG